MNPWRIPGKFLFENGITEDRVSMASEGLMHVQVEATTALGPDEAGVGGDVGGGGGGSRDSTRQLTSASPEDNEERVSGLGLSSYCSYLSFVHLSSKGAAQFQSVSSGFSCSKRSTWQTTTESSASRWRKTCAS